MTPEILEEIKARYRELVRTPYPTSFNFLLSDDLPNCLMEIGRLQKALRDLYSEFRNSSNLDKDQFDAMQQASDVLEIE